MSAAETFFPLPLHRMRCSKTGSKEQAVQQEPFGPEVACPEVWLTYEENDLSLVVERLCLVSRENLPPLLDGVTDIGN